MQIKETPSNKAASRLGTNVKESAHKLRKFFPKKIGKRGDNFDLLNGSPFT